MIVDGGKVTVCLGNSRRATRPIVYERNFTNDAARFDGFHKMIVDTDLDYPINDAEHQPADVACLENKFASLVKALIFFVLENRNCS